MTKRLCIIAGTTIFLSITGIVPVGEAGTMIIPDVGEGQCVKPGPDGKPEPCGQEHQRSLPATSPTPRRTRVPSQPSITPSRSNLPCNQIPWENDQKRHCAERVQKDCKKRHTEGSKEFQECVFKGLTGEGKEKKAKVRESQKKKVKEKRGQQSTPSPRKQPRVIGVPASQAPTSPPPPRSQPVLPEEETTPSFPKSPSSSKEQCIFPFYPDCRSKCQGLPSYPTFEFENCLTRCDKTYQATFEEYNRCQEK